MQALSAESMIEYFDNKRSTNTLEKFFDGIAPVSVNNPITLTENDCQLRSTKKHKYYIHRYDPRPILDRLRGELREEVSKFGDIFDKFDATPRENCCNVISLTLYFKDCTQKEILIKYLYSIYRTIKNVRFNLPDWIVRLYLDKSVFDCMNTVNFVLNSNLCGMNQDLHAMYAIFQNIKESENVEIYTFVCKSIGTTLPYEKTRTFRYLILQDPEVNVCVLRDADGSVSNTDCHNLKIFSQSDRLFYFPLLLSNVKLIDNDRRPSFLKSYNNWLENYKKYMRNTFFSENQNMYDLLAGMIATRLKLKSDYYFQTMNGLYNEINNLPKAKTLNLIVGFDEIFLLEIYKEIISISEGSSPEYWTHKRDLLFFADNVLTYRYTATTPIEQIVEELKELKIIKPDFVLDKPTFETYLETIKVNFRYKAIPFPLIDALILHDIISDQIICIRLMNVEAININTGSPTIANEPCSFVLNDIYDRIQSKLPPKPRHMPVLQPQLAENSSRLKYLKYKRKYLELKNKYNMIK
jgi:hypothetical protein